jgi:hypothetical protein
MALDADRQTIDDLRWFADNPDDRYRVRALCWSETAMVRQYLTETGATRSERRGKLTVAVDRDDGDGYLVKAVRLGGRVLPIVGLSQLTRELREQAVNRA